MKKNGNQHANHQKPVGQEPKQLVLVQRILDELGNPKQGKVHPFVFERLPAQQESK